MIDNKNKKPGTLTDAEIESLRKLQQERSRQYFADHVLSYKWPVIFLIVGGIILGVLKLLGIDL